MQIRDKIAIVTGASGGIGLAVARLLAEKGARGVLAARSAEKLKQLEREIPGSFAVPTDMRKPHYIRHLVQQTEEKFGRIDILINNAGQGLRSPVASIDLRDYRELMELNVFAVLEAMQAVIPIMRK
jgi:NADP-dependent 3-hydroxy acid dehydrogenase YdfG